MSQKVHHILNLIMYKILDIDFGYYYNYICIEKQIEENLPFTCQYAFFSVVAGDIQEPTLFCSITTNY